jgi:hypothetical protein
MEQGWRPDDHGDDEDRWRGELHVAESWRPKLDDASWRGEDHFADWPEAGPEYWMYKQAAEDA